MFRLGGVYTTTTSTGTQGGGSESVNTCQELFVALDLFMLSSFMSDFCQDQRRSDLAAAVTPPLHPARSLQPTLHLSRPSLQIVPVTLSDIGQGIKVVTLTVKEWLMEPRDTANSDEDTEHISGWSLQC